MARAFEIRKMDMSSMTPPRIEFESVKSTVLRIPPGPQGDLKVNLMETLHDDMLAILKIATFQSTYCSGNLLLIYLLNQNKYSRTQQKKEYFGLIIAIFQVTIW